jgi:hypothetical protein
MPKVAETTVSVIRLSRRATRLDKRMDENSLDPQAVHNLAQYRPFQSGSADMETAHDDLVVAACQGNGGAFTSLDACRVFISDEFRVDLEIVEIRDSRDRLETAGQAVRDAGGLSLTPVTRALLDAERAEWERARETAFAEWEVSLRKAFPVMPDEHIKILESQVQPWLDRVIALHGAEAGLLLYPAHPRAAKLEQAIRGLDLGFLPECDAKLKPHRRDAFRMLVRDPTAAQREFLGRLLNTGFYLTVMTLDPRARQLAEAEMSKVTLYLDTNFLYAVLGVGGATETFGAKRMLELCQQLGVSLRISPWTADELRTSIASSRQDVEKFARSKKTAAVMAQVSGEKGFASAYWREASTTGTDPESFFGRFAHFQRFLDHYGIEEHPEGVPEVEANWSRLRDYASPLEAIYGPGVRPRIVVEHDAKMRLLIEQLRAQHKPPAGYTDVRYWFLTESTRLPIYARMPIEGSRRPEYPFCILSSTWAQLLRAMVPRTDDLNDMVVGLLSSPFVGYRSGLRGAAQLKAVERVVQRIDALSDVPPSVAIAVVNDESMATKIGEETNERVVDELVDAALSAKARQLEEQVAAAAGRVVKAERERDRAEARRREADAERARLQAESDEAQVHQAATVKELKESIAAHQSEAESLRADVQEVKRRVDEAEEQKEQARVTSRRRRRNIAAILSSLAIDGAGAALIVTGTVSDTVGVIALIAVMVLSVYVAARVVAAHLAREIVAVLGIVSAIATLGALVAAPDVQHRGGKPGQQSGVTSPKR